jgi:hypothetical protein
MKTARQPAPRWRRPRLIAATVALSASLLGPGLPLHGVVAQPHPPPPVGLPDCRIGDTPAPLHGYDDWAGTLLDTEHRLASDYRPPDLVEVRDGERSVPVRALVVDDLRAMLDAAQRDGTRIGLTSGYRSHRQQADLFERISPGTTATSVVRRRPRSGPRASAHASFCGSRASRASNQPVLCRPAATPLTVRWTSRSSSGRWGSSSGRARRRPSRSTCSSDSEST